MATLLFDYDFDERAQDEATARGYLSHVRVQLANGKIYPVIFYDHVRLGQDLEEEVNQGTEFVADPGMIILNEVTLTNMQRAIDRLELGRFFQSFVPVSGS